MTVTNARSVMARMALAATLFLAFSPRGKALGASPDQIENAIKQAVAYLEKAVEQRKVYPHEAGLVAYGMIQGGAAPDSPAVKELIRVILESKFKKGNYETDNSHQFYEAGVDLMALAAADPGGYAKQIDDIAGFIAKYQAAKGSWFYHERPDTGGDTSVTQYAVLGLWAAARSGTRISNGIWDREGAWHLHTQLPDGGFAYHPGEGVLPSHSMTVNGVASLCVARLYLYPRGDYTLLSDEEPDKAPEKSPKKRGKIPAPRTKTATRPELRAGAGDSAPESARFGLLRRLDLGTRTGSGRPATHHGRATIGQLTPGGNLVSLARMNKGIARGVAWIRDHYTVDPKISFNIYYLYGLERMCALAGVTDFNGRDWFAEGADYLVRSQGADGHFVDGSGLNAATSFGILFLSRTTAKLLGNDTRIPLFGGGLMIGGRGLPGNLGAVQTTSDGVQVRKLEAPIEQLLAELENPKGNRVESAQQALVERVQLGDREKLIGQKDRLLRLARDPRAEVRRTALWALGRCGTIHDALIFVKALDDPDIGVVVEAHNALCWLSRRPNGFGRPADPLAEVPETATEKQKQAAIAAWRAEVRTDWRKWFDEVRPYSERELPIDLR